MLKSCAFTYTFGACSLSSISYKQKKILLTFRTYEYPKNCAQIILDVNNAPK